MRIIDSCNLEKAYDFNNPGKKLDDNRFFVD